MTTPSIDPTTAFASARIIAPSMRSLARLAHRTSIAPPPRGSVADPRARPVGGRPPTPVAEPEDRAQGLQATVPSPRLLDVTAALLAQPAPQARVVHQP